MKNKKILSFILATALMLSSALMAFAEIPKGSVVIGNKSYDLEYANSTNKAIRAEIQKELLGGGKIYVKSFNGKWLDNLTKKILDTAEVTALIPELTHKDKDGKVTAYEKGDGKEKADQPEQPQVLNVAKVTVVNKTTINVEFDKAPAKPLGKADFEKLGVEGAKLLSVNQGVQPTVYTLTVEALTGKGTVKVGDKSVAYDLAAASNTNVASVTLDNYRQITVKFVNPVSKASATDLKNYYFELIQGDAGEKLGAAANQAELDKDYQLDQIKDSTAAAKKPVAKLFLAGKDVTNDISVKTADEVRIHFDLDARVGNYVTGDTSEKNIINIKDLAGQTGKSKLLDKNSIVHFSTRDIANPEGKKVYDTSVTEIKIIDEVNPELIMVTDQSKKVLDFTKKPFEMDFNTNPKLILTFNEPIGVKDEQGSDLLPFGVGQLNLNGETVTVTQTEVKVEDKSYDKMCKVVLDLKAIATQSNNNKNIVQIGQTSTLQLTGLRDIAGNLAPNVVLNFKFKKPGTTPDVEPKVLGVEQVADNVFAVLTNKKNMTGILNIKRAGDGSDVKALIPYTNKEVDATFVELDKKWKKYLGAYFSLVEVKATGLVKTKELSYDGQAETYRDVAVEMVAEFPNKNETIANAKLAEPFERPNMLIAMDIFGPEYVAKTEKTDKDNGKLTVAVQDVIPESYYRLPSNIFKYAVKANKEDGNGVNEANEATGEAFSRKARLMIEYTNDEGVVVNKVQDLTYTHDDNNEAAASASINKLDANLNANMDTLTFDLKAWSNTSNFTAGNHLPVGFLDSSDKLIAGATYTIKLPAGVITDEYFGVASANLENGTHLPAADEDAYIDNVYNGSTTANTTDPADVKAKYYFGARTKVSGSKGRGVEAGEKTLVFTVEAAADPKTRVPQTSADIHHATKENKAVRVEDLVDGGQELVVHFTGNPTVESLRNLDNYQLNGQTFKSLGAQPIDVMVSDAKSEDKIGTTDATKVVRIRIPKNSITVDGPARVTIENVAHEDGGRMATVDIPAVDGFKDNTSPVLQSATYTKSGAITLTFDEAVKLAPTSTSDAAKQNLEITVNGVGANISSLGVNGSNVVTIQIQNNNLSAETNLVLKFKNNAEGIMNLQDDKANKLDPTYSSNANVQLTFN